MNFSTMANQSSSSSFDAGGDHHPFGLGDTDNNWLLNMGVSEYEIRLLNMGISEYEIMSTAAAENKKA